MHVIDVLKRFLDKLKPPEPYANAHNLVERSIQRHRKAVGFYPACPFCDTELMFRWSNLSRFGWPLREDQCWKCPNCFFTCTFGIPLTRQQWREEHQLRKGYVLMRPDLRLDEKVQAGIVERLKALGYLEMEVESRNKK